MRQSNMDKDPGTSSILSIQLTSEEMSQLRDIASSAGTEPSTYVSNMIKNSLSRNSKSLDSDFKSAAAGGIALIQLEKEQINSDIVQSALDTLQNACRCTIINPPDMGYADIEKLIQDDTSL
jgi:hypothetical protein